MKRIAVVTANIGGFDEIKGICKQTIEIDYFHYTENNLPFPLPNLNNRLKSKYIKTQMHRFLPDYDYYVWLDGSIRVNGGNFIEHITENIEANDISMYIHRERKSVYEELDFIDSEIKKGNPYLVTRYAHQQMIKEALFYAKNKVPFDYPLYG